MTLARNTAPSPFDEAVLPVSRWKHLLWMSGRYAFADASVRLTLLAAYNPLGLVYQPFAYAGLKLTSSQ